MKKIIVAFGILLLIFFLISCEKEEVPTKSPFISGSQGIIAKFEQMGIEEGGVETVYENEDFPIEITLKNKGEEDVEVGHVWVVLKGIDTALYGISDPDKENSVKLEKVSEYNKLGGEETLDFGNAKLAEVIGSYYDTTIFANIDYDYKTYVAVPKVCFKYDLTDKTICDVTGSKRVYSSSAPVQVRSVKQDPAGNKRIALTFEVENVGGGRMTVQGEDFSNRYDGIAFSLSESDWECKSAGNLEEARFADNKATIRCVSPSLSEDTLYTKQVTLELVYKYRDVIQKTVRIKESPSD